MLDFSNFLISNSDTKIYYANQIQDITYSYIIANRSVLIQNYGSQSATTVTATVNLVAGLKYTFVVRYQQFASGTSLKVGWKRPSQTLTAPYVPQLDELEQTIVNLKVFSNKNSKGIALTIPATTAGLDNAVNPSNNAIYLTYDGFVDASTCMNYTAYTTLTAAGIVVPNAGTYYSTQIIFNMIPVETGTYTFSTQSDDGSDLLLLNSYVGGLDTWQTWQKPKNAKMVHITSIGAGGGGGSGFSTIDTTVLRGGGAGGGGGAVTKTMHLASSLPDILYVQPGVGGKGAKFQSQSYGNAGACGQTSFVSIAPTMTYGVINYALGGGGGRGGAEAPVNTYSYPTQTINDLNLNNLYSTTLPVVGGQGTALLGGSVGGSVSALTSSITCGGAGGGTATNGDGGSILPASILLTAPVSGAGSVASTSSPISSSDGYGLLFPIFCGTGGAGGAGNSVGNGGNGGNGFYGCGGGGSAGSNLNSGTGGKGGNGIVIITTSF